MIQDAVRPEELRSTLEDVLTSNGIPSDVSRNGGLPEWLNWIPESSLPFMGGMLRVALVVAALVAIFYLVRVLIRYGRSDAFDEAVERRSFEETRIRVGQLRKDAQAAEHAGDLGLALRLYLFALVVGLGENGELEFRPAWTNRELIARGQPKIAVERTLTGLLDELDPKTFGSEPALSEDVRRMESICDDLLGKYAA